MSFAIKHLCGHVFERPGPVPQLFKKSKMEQKRCPLCIVAQQKDDEASHALKEAMRQSHAGAVGWYHQQVRRETAAVLMGNLIMGRLTLSLGERMAAVKDAIVAADDLLAELDRTAPGEVVK